MSHDLAFLHTARVHVKTFETLVSRLNPKLKVKHKVNEGLLDEARKNGLSPELTAEVKKAMLEASATGARVVVCTCSTIGSIAEAMQDELNICTMRIDRAMANEAVSLAKRILVVAALESTLEGTKELLEDSAQKLGKTPELDMLHIENAWPFFEAGDTEAYAKAIAKTLERSWQTYDVIVLAQASMVTALKHCQVISIPILTSPELGVRAAIAALENV